MRYPSGPRPWRVDISLSSERPRTSVAKEPGSKDWENAPMPMQRPINQRLVAVFLLGWVLFTFPLLSLFNRAELVFGVPVFFAYLFGVWALFIAMIALAVERRR
jgi:hypothetical protein